MLRLLPNPWLMLGALVGLAGAFGWGWHLGSGVVRDQHRAALAEAQAAAMDAAQAQAAIEAERLAAEAQAADLARQLEDMAHADPATGCGLPAGRVLRLNRY